MAQTRVDATEFKKLKDENNSLKEELALANHQVSHLEDIIDHQSDYIKELKVDVTDAQADAAHLEVNLRLCEGELSLLAEDHKKIPVLVKKMWGVQ